MSQNYVCGTCSLCGGAVMAPAVWHGIIPPEQRCTGCGAVRSNYGPVIDMSPRPTIKTTTSSATSATQEINTTSGTTVEQLNG